MSKTKAAAKKKPEEDYFSTLADQSGSDNDESENENQNNNDDEAIEKKPIKIKSIVRKPQPKLDPTRLCGQRGLDCLLETFQKFKSKGENHEFQDLNNMVAKYEYWSHRLFPKMKFNDVVERLEKLGEKREVKNKMNSLRMGMNENKENDVLDLAAEDEAMTERVMGMMKNINTSDDDEDNNDCELNNQTKRIEHSACNVSDKQALNKNNQQDEDEDEDELFNRLLNENSAMLKL